MRRAPAGARPVGRSGAPQPADPQARADPSGPLLGPCPPAARVRGGCVALAGRLRGRQHLGVARRGRRRHLRPVKFADTGWWVAWALPGDTRHHDALGMLAALGRSEQVLTSNLVVGETWTFLRRKDSHRTAVTFLDRVDALVKADRLAVHRVTEAQQAAAWA